MLHFTYSGLVTNTREKASQPAQDTCTFGMLSCASFKQQITVIYSEQVCVYVCMYVCMYVLVYFITDNIAVTLHR